MVNTETDGSRQTGAHGTSAKGRTFTLLAFLAVAGCEPQAATAPVAHDPLHQAFLAAFGKPAPWSTINDSDDHVVYSPEQLIDVRPGVVALVSREEIPGGCRKCAGSLTIDYLARAPDGFRRLGHFDRIGGEGFYGRALPWTVRNDLDDGPTLAARRDLKEGGCSSTKLELITLRENGPVKVAEVTTATANAASSDGPASAVSGEIKPIKKGQSFVLDLTGSAHMRQVFRREGPYFATHDYGAVGC